MAFLENHDAIFVGVITQSRRYVRCETTVTESALNARLKPSQGHANGIANPSSSKLLSCERSFVDRFGLGLPIAALAVVIGIGNCRWRGQFCFNRLAVFDRDPIEAVHFLVDLALDLCKLLTALGYCLRAAEPGRRSHEVVGG